MRIIKTVFISFIVLSSTFTIYPELEFQRLKAESGGPVVTIETENSGKENLTNLVKPNLTIVSATYTTITLNYSEDVEADGYKIYRATKKKGKYKLIETTVSTTYVDSNLKNNKTYYYKIRSYVIDQATGKVKHSAYSAIQSQKTTNLAKPSLKTTTVFFDTIRLDFGDLDSESDGLMVYRATSKNGKYKFVATVIADDYFIHDNLPFNKTYYYRIRAYKVIDGNTIYGPYSAKKKASTNFKKPYFSSWTGSANENRKAYIYTLGLIEEKGWSLDNQDEFTLAWEVAEYVAGSINYWVGNRAYTAYSGLVNKRGTCWAYAHSYLFIAKELGLDVRTVAVRKNQIVDGFVEVVDYETGAFIGGLWFGSDHMGIEYNYKGIKIYIETQQGRMYIIDGRTYYLLSKDPS